MSQWVREIGVDSALVGGGHSVLAHHSITKQLLTFLI